MPRQRRSENKGFPTGWRWRGMSLYYMVPKATRKHWDGQTEFKLGRTPAEAYRTWSARLESIEVGEIRTVPKLIAAFKAHHLPTVSAKTGESYLIALERIAAVFAEYEPGEIAQSDAQEFYDALLVERSPSVARSNAGVLKTLMTFAAKRRDVPGVKTNPLLGMRFAGAGSGKRYVSDEEIDAVLSMPTTIPPASTPHRPTILALAYIRLKMLTALRRGDLLRLRRGDIRDDGIHVIPNKTKDTSRVAVVFEWDEDGELREAVDDLLAMEPLTIASDAPLIRTREGKPYIDADGYAAGFDSLWQRLMVRALATTPLANRFTEKDLRAKVASDAPSLQAAADLLLHTSTGVTNRHYRRGAKRIRPTGIGRRRLNRKT